MVSVEVPMQPDGMVWLVVQIDTDEAMLVDGGECRCGDDPQRPDCPDRVLAEVEAKRRIVQLHGETMLPHVGRGGMCRECESASYPCPTVQHLAAVYEGRDGYDRPGVTRREEWRP
jgi:hypothetical protein